MRIMLHCQQRKTKCVNVVLSSANDFHLIPVVVQVGKWFCLCCPLQELMQYCAMDVQATHEVFTEQLPLFKERSVNNL